MTATMTDYRNQHDELLIKTYTLMLKDIYIHMNVHTRRYCIET